jgi:cytidine deaminase
MPTDMTPPSSARLTPDEVAGRLERGQSIDQLMCALLPWAVAFADAPISKFLVGAIAFGGSGALYAGANIEFTGMPLSASVHAEQAAVMNAWSHGEREVAAIAATAAPCGHCRQFLMELGTPERLAIYVAGRPATTLGDLLPSAFGPRDLGAVAALLDHSQLPLRASVDADDALGQAALGAARSSYAPYTGAHAGIALQTAEGTVVTGRYAESAAYNPSLPALQSALVELAFRGIDRTTVTAAVMLESTAAASQRAAAESLLASFSRLRLRYIAIEPS